MQFKVLGPIEVWAAGRRAVLGGAKPQALLALLMLERGRVVPVSRIIDVIWGEHPPETVRSMIQVYVATLRRSLAEVGLAQVIVTRAPGYLLDIPAEALDRDVFADLVARARDSAGAARVELLRDALRLWRGPALAGLAQSALAGEAMRLEESCLAALTDRLAAELDLGWHDEIVAELTALVRTHPADERLCGLLMTALYRQGRQPEALACYRDCRVHLSDELGIDPGPELTALHERLLRGEIATTARAAAVPRLLPRLVDDFTGRHDEIRLLTQPGQSSLRVISGPAGVGKSAVAAQVARQLAASHPDGQLYAELRGMTDTPAPHGEVLVRFLRALGVEPTGIPESTADRSDLFRSLVEGRRLLVVLDDVRDLAQLGPLLPSTPETTVLITSRDRLTGLAGALLIELGVLPSPQAMELFTRIVGAQRVGSDPESARRIVGHCADLPLAIRLAGARLASRSQLPLRWLADRLADESRRLDELSTADSGLRASIELSSQSLRPQTRHALRLIGYFGVPEFACWTVGWLAGCSAAQAETILDELVEAQLIECPMVDRLGNVRYRIHDLVRLWACEQATAGTGADELSLAVSRVLHGWLGHIQRAGSDTPPDDIRWRAHGPAVDSGPALPQPRAWFEAEQTSLVAGVERAASLGLHALASRFAPDQYSPVLSGATRFDTRTRIITAILQAARRAGDRHIEALMIADLGQLYYLQDHYDQARLTFQQALDLFREQADLRGQAATLAGLGAACREPGRLREALHFLGEAATILRRTQDDIGIGYALRMSGSVRLELGDYPQALSDLEESLVAYRRAGSRLGEGLTLRSLGLYHRALSKLDDAVELCEQAASIFRELGDAFLEAYAVRALWKARLRQGLADQRGLDQLDWVLEVSRQHHDRFGEAVTLRVLGQWHLAAGGPDRDLALGLARRHLSEALKVWATMEAPLWTARTQHDLSLVADRQRRTAEAQALRQQAMKVFRDHGAREYQELTAAE
ncbi:BTAD domain-containing putative transcriptional regulator [Catellatospora sp. KI3]|uniref:AfsR/SARP family transcriptional regulator n=1 Tax=Catellatospora sp. KI3 TaxID=3041620 RepID=UPI0024826876|nr:BTAD domain-containing putative transcriptional regulator [Catellatospora sp. KI3]MDI1464769.1 BTAD domain-containing putative transcriptional regulator [Catellatospora sp. KI3]